MTAMNLCCPCHFGLESVLKHEALKIGGANVKVSDGRVSFDGDFETLIKANLCLSTAERVLIRMADSQARSFDELYQCVRNAPWEDFIGKNDAFPVKAGHSLNSALSSIPDCQSIIKKAVADRLCGVYKLPWLEESGAVHTIRFTIIKDEVSLYLDSSGDGLHKRGYRRTSNEAPIKETLAAGILDLARIKSDSVLCDPMCGSGTFLIEGAYRALSVPVGLRRHFAAESWEQIPRGAWDSIRSQLKASINKKGSFCAYGYDVDPSCVDLSLSNARRAGIASRIKAAQQDVRKYKPIKGAVTVCNPPYGERLLEVKQAEELYRILGDRLRPDKDNPCYVISPHEDFESFFGKKADRRRKLYNGMIKCQLFMYYL